MTANFCPKCKKILIQKRIREKEFVLKCRHCGYVKKYKGKPLVEEEEIEIPKEKGEGVLKNKNELATYKHKCKKCGYNKAQIIEVGFLVSDEDYLILLKCGKCGYSERVGRKTT